jgi:hypothetical protein
MARIVSRDTPFDKWLKLVITVQEFATDAGTIVWLRPDDSDKSQC